MKISIILLLHLECITAYIAHLKGPHPDFGRKFEDLLEMDYPLRFVDLKCYKPGDEISKMAETRLNLKEDVKLKARINKEGAFAYILIKDLHLTFQQLEESIIVLPTI